MTSATLRQLVLANPIVILNRPKLSVEFFTSNTPVKSYEFMLPCQWPLWFRLASATLRPLVLANPFVILNRPKLSVEFFISNTLVKSYEFMLLCQWPLRSSWPVLPWDHWSLPTLLWAWIDSNNYWNFSNETHHLFIYSCNFLSMLNSTTLKPLLVINLIWSQSFHSWKYHC